MSRVGVWPGDARRVPDQIHVGLRRVGETQSLQASKSSRKRVVILDAALKCLAERPYSEVTIEAVSKQAGVSKGGVQYHFPSRQDLLSEAVSHLFRRRLDAYRTDLASVPRGVGIPDHIIDNHWRHLTEPEFQIYQQLILASRSNPEFRKLLVRRYRAFIREWREVSFKTFGWDSSDPDVMLLGRLAQYLMEGMAYGRFAEQLSDRDARPMLEFVKDLLRKGLEHTAEPSSSPPKVTRTRPRQRP